MGGEDMSLPTEFFNLALDERQACLYDFTVYGQMVIHTDERGKSRHVPAAEWRKIE